MDGILKDVATLPVNIHQQIISKIKVLSKLQTDEHQKPQDGKIKYSNNAIKHLDLRVSVVPASNGEKAVL